MRILAITKRILRQQLSDKRALSLILIAPIVILTIMYFAMTPAPSHYNIGIINAPVTFTTEIATQPNMTAKSYELEDAKKAIERGEIIAAVSISENLTNIDIFIDGSSSVESENALILINDTIQKAEIANQKIKLGETSAVSVDKKISYIYGSESTSLFDDYSSALISILIFTFVYLFAGIKFMSEKRNKTLHKMLSTPVKRSEIVLGYMLAFSFLTIIQTSAITLFAIYILKMQVVGSFPVILLVSLLTSAVAFTLAILVSALCENENQFILLIPIIILPQILLCGIFKLSGFLKTLSTLSPLTHINTALNQVVIKGASTFEISESLVILVVLTIILAVSSTISLKKYRKV